MRIYTIAGEGTLKDVLSKIADYLDAEKVSITSFDFEQRHVSLIARFIRDRAEESDDDGCYSFHIEHRGLIDVVGKKISVMCLFNPKTMKTACGAEVSIKKWVAEIKVSRKT